MQRTQSEMKPGTEEAPLVEQVDQDFSEESIKKDASENADEAEKSNRICQDLVEKLSEILKNDWEKLASKLGYTNDEVIYY